MKNLIKENWYKPMYSSSFSICYFWFFINSISSVYEGNKVRTTPKSENRKDEDQRYFLAVGCGNARYPES